MSKGVFEAKCTACGKLFLVPPIGEEYIEILQVQCERGDSIPIERRCPVINVEGKYYAIGKVLR